MVAMDEPHRFREVEVERILLREPNGGRVRAILETAPPRDPDSEVQVPIVRLTLLTPTGEPALVAEVGPDGSPRVFVGHPDRGPALVLTGTALDIWSQGNVVASLRSTETRGRLDLFDADGEPT
jgi:hypothetical protein